MLVVNSYSLHRLDLNTHFSIKRVLFRSVNSLICNHILVSIYHVSTFAPVVPIRHCIRTTTASWKHIGGL